jgi:hypothetical protein
MARQKKFAMRPGGFDWHRSIECVGPDGSSANQSRETCSSVNCPPEFRSNHCGSGGGSEHDSTASQSRSATFCAG